MRLISGRAKHFLDGKLDPIAVRRGEEEHRNFKTVTESLDIPRPKGE
jgi:hypothetical protein